MLLNFTGWFKHMLFDAAEFSFIVLLNYCLYNCYFFCRLCITFLAVDVFFVVICVAVACVIGIAVCCCLPCIIAILYAVADQVIDVAEFPYSILMQSYVFIFCFFFIFYFAFHSSQVLPNKVFGLEGKDGCITGS